MAEWIHTWPWAFGWTLAIEWLIALPLLRRVDGSYWRRCAGVALLNLLTHPLVWFAFPKLAAPYAVRTSLAEASAWAIEAIGYVLLWPSLGFVSSWLIALAANAASFAVGLLIQTTSWP